MFNFYFWKKKCLHSLHCCTFQCSSSAALEGNSAAPVQLSNGTQYGTILPQNFFQQCSSVGSFRFSQFKPTKKGVLMTYKVEIEQVPGLKSDGPLATLMEELKAFRRTRPAPAPLPPKPQPKQKGKR